MSIAHDIDEPSSVAAEALRLAQTLTDPTLVSVLYEIAAIFGENQPGSASEAA
jgi:hypothetical protein